MEPITISTPVIELKEGVHEKKVLKEVTLVKKRKSISVAASVLFFGKCCK